MTVFFDTEREQQLLARIRELEEMILRHTDLCPFGGGADGKRVACAFGRPGCACADWYNEHGWNAEPEPVPDAPAGEATQPELDKWFGAKDKPGEEAAKAAIEGA